MHTFFSNARRPTEGTRSIESSGLRSQKIQTERIESFRIERRNRQNQTRTVGALQLNATIAVDLQGRRADLRDRW